MKLGTKRDKPSEFVCFAASVLRGDYAGWPTAWASSQELGFLEQARKNGVEALLFHRLCKDPKWRTWPPKVRETLRTNTQLDAAIEIYRKCELNRVLDALSEAGLKPLLFKGTPLAYGLYAAPHLRPRVDTDLLLSRPQINRVEDVMGALGYQRQLAIPGDTILSQMILNRTDKNGLSHTFDVHWKIANPQAFADILAYENLLEDCQPVAQIGPSADAPSTVHALLIACIHRAAHHLASNRLIWLYDIDLLVKSMSSGDLARFGDLALENGIGSVCLDAIVASQRYFATPLPVELLAELQTNVTARNRKTTDAYVTRPRNRLELLWRDVRSKAGLGAVLRSLKQQALPPPSYMLRRYDTHNKALLPYLYTKRLLEGIPKLIKRL